MAAGLGADVTLLDTSLARLKDIDMVFGGRIKTLMSTVQNIEDGLREADLVIGAVLVPGATAPKLVRRAQLKLMKPGTVLVDVAIDQGGCFETSRPTTHQQPTFEVDGIVHYCVANMPGAVSRTATMALTHATLPFIRKLAALGTGPALATDPHLLAGLNVCAGQVTHAAVAHELGYDYVPAATAVEALLSR